MYLKVQICGCSYQLQLRSMKFWYMYVLFHEIFPLKAFVAAICVFVMTECALY